MSNRVSRRATNATDSANGSGRRRQRHLNLVDTDTGNLSQSSWSNAGNSTLRDYPQMNTAEGIETTGSNSGYAYPTGNTEAVGPVESCASPRYYPDYYQYPTEGSGAQVTDNSAGADYHASYSAVDPYAEELPNDGSRTTPSWSQNTYTTLQGSRVQHELSSHDDPDFAITEVSATLSRTRLGGTQGSAPEPAPPPDLHSSDFVGEDRRTRNEEQAYGYQQSDLSGREPDPEYPSHLEGSSSSNQQQQTTVDFFGKYDTSLKPVRAMLGSGNELRPLVSLKFVQNLGYGTRDYKSGPRALPKTSDSKESRTVGGIELSGHYRSDGDYQGFTETFDIVKFIRGGCDVLLPPDKYPVPNSTDMPVYAATIAAAESMN
ncbi:hypothetical protein B0H63DRAFT_560259 [Podospora didyma]|uniref:Uncharacterized protein n=1 Tax=Podospora didyma TaxID=330526 RepID=A0AAE0NQB7_9PEZI|nr:hypothetical protein B0H63DRAFT_560259 [Podospora didyma]